ncbi:MAG: hypothetical protein ACREFD_16440 [Stellaceae bacterium]
MLKIRLMPASCSCEAPAASSAPLAICSIAARNWFAADEASANPLASSSVAAATRSEEVSCRTPDFLLGTLDFPSGGVASGASRPGDGGRRALSGRIFEVFTRAIGGIRSY